MRVFRHPNPVPFVRSMHGLACLAGLLMALTPLSPAAAHELGVARVELRETGGGRYELAVTISVHRDFELRMPTLPPRFTLDPQPTILRRPGVAVMTFRFAGSGPPLQPGDVLFLPWPREGALLTAQWADGGLRSTYVAGEPTAGAAGGIAVPVAELRSPSLEPRHVAARYFRLGIEHILTGYDHLAFVLCLCLIARGWRLVKLVTGFTLGHSLSLALAAFDVLRLPSPPTEACIALSIAFVAREALLPANARHHNAALVFAFGLLHGLGFAGALKEVGIGRAELLLGLLTFNLGVEAGQLLFVAGVLLVIRVGGRWLPGRGWHALCATLLGMLATYWTLDRLAAFSGLAAGLAAGLGIALILVRWGLFRGNGGYVLSQSAC